MGAENVGRARGWRPLGRTPRRSWGHRRWLTERVIALVLAVGTTLALLPYLQLNLQTVRGNQAMGADEMGHLATALSVRRGHVLYRDVFSFKGPVGLVPFVAAYTVAPATVKTGRFVAMAIVGVWTGVMYLLGWTLTGRRSFAIPFALMVPFVVWPSWPYAYPDFLAQLFVTLAILAVARAHAAGWRRGWYVAGGSTALALWAQIGQGGPLVVSLVAGVTLTLVAFGRIRAALRALQGLVIGFAAVVAAVIVWMAANGVTATALRSIFVYPALGYSKSPYNHTRYGVDAGMYAGAWLRHGNHARDIVQGIVDLDVQLPRIGVAAAAVVVVVAAGIALARRIARTKGDVMSGSVPVASVAAAAGAAVCLPAVLNTIRTDLCHLGFVATGGLIAGAGLVALGRGSRGWGQRVSLVATRLFGAGLTAIVLASGGLYAFAATRPTIRGDIDEYGRRALETDLAVARTRPGDLVFAASFGGWHYLYTGRENPTPYFWLYTDVVSDEHWPIAADHIRRNEPRLLLMSSRHFDRLVQLQPVLRSRYFGYDGNYMLDDRRPGPPLPLGRPWAITTAGTVRPAVGGAAPVRVTFSGGPRTSSLGVALIDNGRPRQVMGSVDGDIVCIFDGAITYAGRLVSGGGTIEGHRYQHNQPPLRFTARLENP